MTSRLPVVNLRGNIFGRTIYPPSLIVIAYVLAKVFTSTPSDAVDRFRIYIFIHIIILFYYMAGSASGQD